MGSRVGDLTGWTRDLRKVRQEWSDAEASTAPADRYEAEFGIALAYDAARLAPPHTVIWVPDPALGAVVAARLTMPGRRVSARVWTGPRHQAQQDIRLAYSKRARDQAGAATKLAERDRVGPAIRSAALGRAFTSRNAKLPLASGGQLNTVWQAERARVEASMATWGQHAFWSHNGNDSYRKLGARLVAKALGPTDTPFEAHPQYGEVKAALAWAVNQHAHLGELATFDALSRLLSGDAPQVVEGLVRVARSAGWWWPFEDVAVVCERPSVRLLDREGRLHAENGPALAYPGGFSAYFWHGRVVPRWAVTEPTVERIAREANVEIRRCAIEAMGWARFADEAGLTLVDDCADPGNPGQRLELYSVPGKVWGMPASVLVCTNGSVDLDGGRHTFGLLVPVTVGSAMGAAAWGYGLTAREYAGLERRA
jgi:hypothetical protein